MDGFAAQFAPCGLVELDVDGVIIDVNPRFAHWAGADRDDLMGRRLVDLVEDAPAAEVSARSIEDQKTGPNGTRSLTVKLLPITGEPRPVLISWGREGDRILVALFDATKREEFENRIAQEHSLVSRQERRLNLLLRSAVRFADAMDEGALADELADVAREAYSATSASVLLVDERGKITIAAGTMQFMTEAVGESLSEGALELRSVMAFPDVNEASGIPEPVLEVLSGAGVRGLLVAPIVHESRQMGLLAVFFDHVRPFDAEAAPLAQALTRQAGQVMARIELSNQLHRSAMLDEITGLPNRRLFEEQVHRAAQTDALVGVAFIDLDGFKAVNDTLGHDAGDRVLREVARRIQSVVREQDSVARFGGDEFVAVWTVHSVEAAESIADRIRDAIAAPYDIPQGLTISASIGLAVSRTHPEPQVADRLVRVADQAMYRAKTDGGNRVIVAAS
jgi:diguanylate cyclase (GGDEF)-like protein/PAS domain S-box-containing protein